jgi:hypothetical protein
MARAKQWGTDRPGYDRPAPRLNTSRPTLLTGGKILTDAFPSTVMVLQLDRHSMIVVPGSYNDDDSLNAPWIKDDAQDMKRLFKTCVAYEIMGDNHPHLLQFLSRDPWTDLPVFTKPSGPGLEKFIRDNHTTLYPPALHNNLIRLDLKFQPLVLSWALQLLSALKFVHSHNILYGTLEIRSFWLSKDLSLLLVGFMDAAFHDGYGYQGYSSVPNISVKSDLYGWALFVYRLMTNNNHGWPEIRDFPGNGTPSLPSDFPAGEVLQKCYTQRYENVQQLWIDFQAVMTAKGYELDGDLLKDFDIHDLLQGLILTEEE